jgi:dihydrofolate reductase
VGGREFADKFNTMPKHVVSSTLRELADELRLMVVPVVLGTGKRLFGETTDKKRLQLSSSTVVGDGVAIQVYTRT